MLGAVMMDRHSLIDRRRFGVAALAIVAQPQSLRAQQPQHVPRVGVIVSGSSTHPFMGYFRKGLLALGYTDGTSIQMTVRYTDGRADAAKEAAADFVGLPVDVIVAHFTPSVGAAKALTKTIPIIMAPAGAPVEVGLVESLSKPGGNVTGVSAMDAEVGGKRLQLLREIVPNLKRVAVLASTTDPFATPFLNELARMGQASDIEILPIMASGPADFPEGFVAMERGGAQAVMIQGLFSPHRTVLIDLANRHRLPLLAQDRETTEAGGLISYGVDYAVLIERCATFVDKILKGTKPADLPVEQATRFELVVNAKVAKTFGFTVPPSILLLANNVVE
jgi:putative tryptophan/tyrosine transport system substrate-binding protein